MEARILILAPNNIFSPSGGREANHDIHRETSALGCYYLTQESRAARLELLLLNRGCRANAVEVEFAMADGAVKNARDRIRLQGQISRKDDLWRSDRTCDPRR